MTNYYKLQEYEAHKAELPSYEEWQQTRELLKQSRIYVKIDTEDYDDRVVSQAEKDEAKKLLTKIDEVLDEI